MQNIAIPDPNQGWEYYEALAATETKIYLVGNNIDHVRVLDRVVTRDGQGEIVTDVITDNSITYPCTQTSYQNDIAVARTF